MSAEQELPRPGSVWRKGDDEVRVRAVTRPGKPPEVIFILDDETLPRRIAFGDWLAWAAGAKCIHEGVPDDAS